MGIYVVDCVSCKKSFQWFSGTVSTTGQVCPECQKPQETPKKSKKMNNQKEQIESLKQVISVQTDLINYLKAEVERLKVSQIYINGQPNVDIGKIGTPSNPTLPLSPWWQPWVSQGPYPQYPGQPLTPPYVITSGTQPIIPDPNIHIGDPPGPIGGASVSSSERITLTSTAGLPFGSVQSKTG